MRRGRARPIHLLLAGGLLAAASLLTTSAVRPAPAWANTEKAFNIGVGQSITRTYSDLAGDDGEGDVDFEDGNPNYTSNAQDPPDCDPQPSCDDIPITLQVPKSALTPNNNYLLKVSFTYQGGPGANTPLGGETVNTIQGSLWDNPIPTKGPHANGQDASCAGDPCVMNEASPDTNKFSLVADQITGTANTFTLTISLVDVGSGPGSGPPVCGGAGAPACPGSDNGGGGTSAPLTANPTDQGTSYNPPASGPEATPNLPSASAIGIPLPTFNVAPGGPNPALAALSSVNLGSVLGLGGKTLKAGGFLSIPAARPASTLAVVLSFVTAPVLMGLGAVWLLRRRRSLVL
ncbi:MAG TPA: hypothetical protein VE990_17495 [Acidimicrobiales bacterium]|nr:hypothetical protein [Acidimicrobiales bacterium]